VAAVIELSAATQKRTWRCGHPRTTENTRGASAANPRGQCRTCYNVATARYQASPKGRATKARYRRTEKSRAARAKYAASPKGRAARRAAQVRYDASPEGRARHARYRRTAKRRVVVARHQTPTRVTWQCIWRRCSDPSNNRYRYYGGRGIRVCRRWKNYAAFLEDMGKGPPGTTLDRIDVNGDYTRSNCRWATPSEQRRNQRPRQRTA
jgi:hypothetical protein